MYISDGPDSNRRPSRWQRDVLPTELPSLTIFLLHSVGSRCLGLPTAQEFLFRFEGLEVLSPTTCRKAWCLELPSHTNLILRHVILS